jgi:pycsar effector protein
MMIHLLVQFGRLHYLANFQRRIVITVGAGGRPSHWRLAVTGRAGDHMEKSKQEEIVEKCLVATLNRVLDFIKFAETKNGVLATLSSGWLVAIAGYFGSSKSAAPMLATAAMWATPFIALTAILSILSFFPKINLSSRTRLNSTHHLPNLLYFGDIAQLELDEYEAQVRNRYLSDNTNIVPAQYITDLCIQIAVTSDIAASKFALFRWSLISAASGLVIGFIGLVSFAFSHMGTK